MPQDNALHKAANKGDLEECKKWIEDPPEGEDAIDVNELGANDRTPMHRAAGGGFVNIVEYLFSKGGDLNKADKSGRTPLHWAAIAGHVDVLKFLTSNGADIAAVTKTKMNILHAGVEANKPDVIKFIFEFTGDKEDIKLKMCDTKNSDDKYPAEIAVGMKSKELVQLLKDGGDPHAASASCIIM